MFVWQNKGMSILAAGNNTRWKIRGHTGHGYRRMHEFTGLPAY